jgi:hypothetical protein
MVHTELFVGVYSVHSAIYVCVLKLRTEPFTNTGSVHALHAIKGGASFSQDLFVCMPRLGRSRMHTPYTTVHVETPLLKLQ